MSELNFEDLDAVAGERSKSASFEEIALNQSDVLSALRSGAEGLCLQTSIICSGVRELSARVLRHLSPSLRVLSPDDAKVMVSLLQTLETTSLNLNAVSRAILGAAEDTVMAEGPQAEEATESTLFEGCEELRREFFAVARRQGLKVHPETRVDRLAAVADFVGRSIETMDNLWEDEWEAVIKAVEEGRLRW